MLKRLLSRRFGPLPTWAEGHIEAAPIAQLDGWIDGLFEATSLEAPIGPGSDSETV